MFPFFSVYGISFFSFLRQGFCFHWKAPKPILVQVFLQAQVASTAKLFVKNNSKVMLKADTAFFIILMRKRYHKEEGTSSSLANGNNLFLLP